MFALESYEITKKCCLLDNINHTQLQANKQALILIVEI